MQVSSVCKTICTAASRILGASYGLDLCGIKMQHQLGSSLLKKWSPIVRGLILDDESLKAPGLSDFVAANAGGLQTLELWGSEQPTAVTIDHIIIIMSCSKLTSLDMNVFQLLSVFPETLTHLSVSFGLSSDGSCFPSSPSDLLWNLADHQLLEDVSFFFTGADMELACPFLVPELQSFCLRLVLDVESTRMNLSWLHQQPCRQLTVSIKIISASYDAHRQFVDQLRPAHVSNLVLVWNPPTMPRRIQCMWAELHVSEEVRLDYSDPGLFDSATKALQALPCCPRIVMRAGPASSSERQAVYLSGAAIRSHVIKVQLILSKRIDLHMVGGWLQTWKSCTARTTKVWQALRGHRRL